MRVTTRLRAAFGTWLASAALAAGAGCGDSASPAADVNDTGKPSDVAVDAVSSAKDSVVGPADYDAAGPWGVGIAHLAAVDVARNRSLKLTFWYPALTAGPTLACGEVYDTGAKLAQLYAEATPTCVRQTTQAGQGVAAAPGKWPIVVFSHCSGCFRASSASLAERLASHGIAVIAPDHAPNTIFDQWNNAFTGLSDEMLQTRVADVRFALDVVLDPAAPSLPAALRDHCDAAKAGVFGHSFGALTTGAAVASDARLLAGLAIAAPLSSPFPAGPDLATVHKPLLLLLAKEDNSITELGNQFIRDNYASAPGPAWLLEVADAGHFSFSDVAGLQASFQPGCGDGLRQTNDKPFAYLSAATGRQTAARVTVAFFARFLLGRPDAMAALDLPFAASVTSLHKP